MFFFFRFQVYMPFVNWWPGKRGMFSYHRNELFHTFFPFQLMGWWILWFSFGCLFVWIPSEKNSYITCLQLVVYVIPHFWKTSSIFLEQIRLRLLKKHLGRGEEDPAFFQLLENHTEENLKLNLVAFRSGFIAGFRFRCSDIQLLCKVKCTIS